MSEFVRDDDKVTEFVTSDSRVRLTVFHNWNGTVDLVVGEPGEDDFPELATADDCFEIAQFFLALSQRIKSQKLANDLKEIGSEIQNA